MKSILRNLSISHGNKRKSWAPGNLSSATSSEFLNIWSKNVVNKHRAEKTDILTELQPLENKIERMINALQVSRTKLDGCLRTRAKEDNVDKRRKKLEEHHLAAALVSQAKELDTPGGANLLGEVMNLYGNATSEIVDELIQTESELEKKSFERFARFTEYEKNINHQREKLKRAVLDLDSAKRRMNQLNQQSGTVSAEKADLIQDEVDACWYKVDNCRDNLLADMHVLTGKEVDMANIFSVIVELQLAYFKQATQTLEELLPQITEKIATYPKRPVYGCPLEDHLRYSGKNIALVLEVCCCSLVEIGLQDEGLFRISGNATKVRKLKAALDAGDIDLTDYDKDPHSIAGALKSYLRELPDPLMLHNLYNQWQAASRLEGEARLDAVKECLSMLPKSNYDNLRYLVRFLVKVVEKEAVNKMSPSNVAIVIGPNLIWMDSDGDNFLGSKLVETLVTNADFFFPGEIKFTSSLISSLLDKSGGFISASNGPVTAATSKSTQDHRRSPSDFQSQQPPSPPQSNSTPKLTATRPAPVPIQQLRRPKAPAPPPPPSGPGRVQLARGPITEQFESEDYYCEIPTGSGLSQTSSCNDSLNEYGSEPDHDFSGGTPPEDPALTPLRKSPPQDPHMSSGDEASRGSSSGRSSSRDVPRVQITGAGGSSKKAHRKTNSLDRPPEKLAPPKVPPPPYAGGSLERRQKPVPFPNNKDLASLLVASPDPSSSPISQPISTDPEEHTYDTIEGRNPLRPPQPSRENIERRSVLRSDPAPSGGASPSPASSGGRPNAPAPLPSGGQGATRSSPIPAGMSQSVHGHASLYPDLSGSSIGTSHLITVSEDLTPVRPEPQPRKLGGHSSTGSTSTGDEALRPEVAPRRPQLGLPPTREPIKRLSLNIAVNGGAISPDSPLKPKPPLPVKPKLDKEVTHF